MNKDCPCEYCNCTMTSSIHLTDPCPQCLMSHEQYNDYQEGIGIKENKKWGNITEKTKEDEGKTDGK